MSRNQNAPLAEGASLLKHYRLQDPFPNAWSDPVEDAQKQQVNLRRKSTVRYSVLQQDNVSSALKGLIGDGLNDGATLPRDEPDPLGSTDSVVRVLKQRGLPVEDNVRLR
jgi:exocyst complex component 2